MSRSPRSPPIASGSGDHHRDVQRPWLKPREEAIEERGAEEISDDGAGAEAFHVSLRIMLSGGGWSRCVEVEKGKHEPLSR
jgi:hypothetical protein